MYRQLALALLPLLVVAATGCHDGQGSTSCKDIPPGAIPQPNGDYLCHWTSEQRARAEQDRYVIYNYEWSTDLPQLTENGQYHVARMAKVLCQTPYPVMVEPTSDCRLDEMRRMAVVEAFTRYGVPLSADRVVLAKPEAEGLYGQEAAGIDRQYFSNQGGGGGGGSTSVGSSFGSSQGGGSAGGGSSGGGVF